MPSSAADLIVEEHRRQRARAAAAEQGSLFGGDVHEGDGQGELAEDAAPAAPRGRGRPPGSRNKSTDDWVRYLQSRFRSPLIGMAEIANADPHALAAELDCSPLEAADRIQQARRDLAPYLHQKLPQAVSVEGLENGLFTVVLNMGQGGADPAAEPGAMPAIEPVTDAEFEIKQNQGVSGRDPAMSETEGRNR